MPQPLSDSDNKLYKLNLNELRDLLKVITNSYDRLRTKSITMLIGEVAIVTFLFSGGVPIPHVIYGIVFYSVGILMLALAFLSFLWIISPDQWLHPVDLDTPDVTKKKYGSEKNYVEHLINEYIMVIQSNAKKLDFRSKPFVRATYMLSIGIIVMLLLKYGEGNIR